MNVKRVVIFMLVCADNLRGGFLPPSFSVSEYVRMQGVSVMVCSQRK